MEVDSEDGTRRSERKRDAANDDDGDEDSDTSEPVVVRPARLAGAVFNVDDAATVVRKSQLLKGRDQQGLFATAKIDKGTVITWYTGRIYTSWAKVEAAAATASDPKAGDYLFDVSPLGSNCVIYWINGYEPDPVYGNGKRCNANYINHSRNDFNTRFEIVEVQGLDEFPYRVLIQATRTIQAGEELLIDYGKEYEDRLIARGVLVKK